jgi:polysaccharide biosynthesis protein PslE
MQSSLVLQPAPRKVQLADIVDLMFRHKSLLLATFFTGFCLAFISAFLLPRKYEASAKLLVQRERANRPISAEREDAYSGPSEEISEPEMSSEIELLRTDDILHSVVLQLALAGVHPSPMQIDQAVARLGAGLRIEAVNKSNIIGVTYRSTSPELSAKVVNTLIALYFEKHMEISRQTGEFQFFDRQAEHYKQELKSLEKQLANRSVVSPQLARDKMVDRVTDLKFSAAATSASIAETERRIATLKELETHTPDRLVTEERTSDNPQLLQNMNATLLSLQLERDQLVAKYQPTYRPVQDLDKKIADTKAAIVLQESEPLRDQVTNQNSAYEWIRTELAKAQTDVQGLRARRIADAAILSSDQQDLRNLNANGIEEEDLLRETKAAEANYVLYSQKREAARISGELDEKKILNVAVVQNALVPATHVHQRKKLVLFGGFAALVASLGFVLISDFMDPRFRSVDELVAFLDTPVLAAIPDSAALSRFHLESERKSFPTYRNPESGTGVSIPE